MSAKEATEGAVCPVRAAHAARLLNVIIFVGTLRVFGHLDVAVQLARWRDDETMPLISRRQGASPRVDSSRVYAYVVRVVICRLCLYEVLRDVDAKFVAVEALSGRWVLKRRHFARSTVQRGALSAGFCPQIARCWFELLSGYRTGVTSICRAFTRSDGHFRTSAL